MSAPETTSPESPWVAVRGRVARKTLFEYNIETHEVRVRVRTAGGHVAEVVALPAPDAPTPGWTPIRSQVARQILLEYNAATREAKIVTRWHGTKVEERVKLPGATVPLPRSVAEEGV